MDFSEWLALLKRSWLLLVIATVAGALVGLAVGLTQPREYTSTGRLVLSPIGVPVAEGRDFLSLGQYVGARMRTYAEVVESDAVVAEVARELDADWTFRLTGGWEPETTVLTVSATADTPEHAREAAGIATTEATAAVTRFEQTGSDRTGPSALAVDPLTAPVAPTLPSSPGPLAGVLAGAILGFLAGLSLALFRRLRKG